MLPMKLHMTSERCPSASADKQCDASRRPHRKTSPSIAATNAKISTVLMNTLMVLCMVRSATAQQACSCAPREYTFRLDFSGTCPPEPPPFPPNDYFGAGVKDYTCSIGDSPVGESTSEQTAMLEGEIEVDDTQLMDIFPELLVSSQEYSDQTPVKISSIQFIQQDIEGKPIDSTLRDEKKSDGDTVHFVSSIVTKPEEIPFRITMILRGFNAKQEAIMNTFTIQFTNNCGVPTFTEGERIGWVIFDKLTPASSCFVQPIPKPTIVSGYSSKGSKRSSKATSSHSSSKSRKSGKSGKSKSSKGRHRNLHAVQMEPKQHDMNAKMKYQKRNESVSRRLRHRM